jgi:serine/threonine-protein kinase
MSLEPGEVIEGKYRIVRLIGEGGMGAVYEGENVRINRRVAIKVLHAAFAGNADVVKRFEREAQAAGRIGNDHILEVLDLGQLSNGDLFMVMEFLDGEALGQRIKTRGRLTPRELSPIAREVLLGLGAAHDAGIIHRDLKPDNIFLLREKAGKADFVKIIDFGISKFQPLNNEMRMTQTGAVMGTPYYMSPEQAHGSAEVDARSDLYAIGVILYEAVTGSVPFDAATFNQLLFKIVLSEPVPVRQVVPDLDPAFATVVEKAMARDAAHRYQTAQEFAAALQEWEEHGAAVAAPPRASAVSIADITGNVAAVSADTAGQPAFAHSQPMTGAPVVASGAQTSGNWASSQADTPPMQRSRAPLLAALGGAAIVVIGGGALAVGHLSHGQGAASASAAPSAIAAPASAEKPPAEPSATPEAPSAPSASEQAAPPPPPAKPTAPKAPPPTKPSAKVSQHVARRPVATSKPKPTAVPKKPAATAKPGTPDFGY